VKTNIGAIWNGALAVNKDKFDELPKEVQDCMRQAGRSYSRVHAEDVMRRAKTATERMVRPARARARRCRSSSSRERAREVGRDPSQHRRRLGQAKRTRRAGDLTAYMNAMREVGAKPLRQWDKESAATK
jgi:ribulose bisphosphate carboxylase small subunit